MAYSEHLADQLQTLLKGQDVTKRKMFGGLAFLLKGHMFCGVVKDDPMVRLGEEAAATALRQPHTRPMDFTGKPLKSMIYVYGEGVDSDKSLQSWVESALKFARTLAPEK